MNIFHSISDFKSKKKTIVTIGTFDGVHIGHKKIIEKLLQNTSTNQFESVILTFFPHPRMILNQGKDIKLLTTIFEKTALLEKTGLNHLIIHPFDQGFSQLSAEEFVKKVLVDQFNIKKIIIGHDHHFGRNRTANIDDLIHFGKKYDFEVEQISAQEINSISISSTKIRNALKEGNITLANNYLGYDYFLTGTIIKGKQLGRTIGFPTANLKIEEEYKLIPQNGVYVIKSHLNDEVVYGMMNIGLNPTVSDGELSIEIHFFDFDADLYDQKIEVSILKYIRPEQKFDTIELLKNQLEKDKVFSLTYLKN